MDRKRPLSSFTKEFDEPTIGLHPLDVQTLLHVFDALVDNGATVLVIEHDLDVIRNADYIIDMEPGGGEDGGRVVATGTPEEIAGIKTVLRGGICEIWFILSACFRFPNLRGRIPECFFKHSPEQLIIGKTMPL